MSQQHTVGTHATTVSTSDNYTRVVYHATTVVKFNHKDIILNSGGWVTATTKLRMNQASSQFDLGFKVYQKNFKWYVTIKDLKNNTLIIPFRNNKVELYNYSEHQFKGNI